MDNLFKFHSIYGEKGLHSICGSKYNFYELFFPYGIRGGKDYTLTVFNREYRKLYELNVKEYYQQRIKEKKETDDFENYILELNKLLISLDYPPKTFSPSIDGVDSCWFYNDDVSSCLRGQRGQRGQKWREAYLQKLEKIRKFFEFNDDFWWLPTFLSQGFKNLLQEGTIHR